MIFNIVNSQTKDLWGEVHSSHHEKKKVRLDNGIADGMPSVSPTVCL